MVLVALVLASAPVAASGTTRSSAVRSAIGDVCVEAQRLIDESHPRRAIRLIVVERGSRSTTTTTTTTDPPPATGSSPQTTTTTTTIGTDVCAPQLVLARSAREGARSITRAARLRVDHAVATGREPPWDAALSAADRALALDADSRAAATLRSEAEEGLETGAERVQARWSDFVESTLSPAVAPVVALLTTFLALLVVARALTPSTLSWPRLTPQLRVLFLALGPATLAVAAVGLTWGNLVTPTDVPPRFFGVTLATALVLVFATVGALFFVRRASRAWRVARVGTSALAVVGILLVVPFRTSGHLSSGFVLAGAALVPLGILLTTTALATGLRVAVVVGSTDTASEASGRVLAYLRELAADPPAGLEVPRGTDVDALKGGALASLPDNPVLRTLTSIVQGLLGTTPWRVLVDENGTKSVAVVVTRNGRTAGTAVVERDVLLRVATDAGAAPESAEVLDTVDLHKAVAALVVTTLARHHPGFDGLCGTTDWRALALYHVATSDCRRHPALRCALLARALDLDPGSWPAQLAYRSTVERRSTDPAVLGAYRKWLTLLLDGGERAAYEGAEDLDDVHPVLGPGNPAFAPLRLRALYARACLAINEQFAAGRDVTTFGADAVDDVVRLVTALNAEPGQQPTGVGEPGHALLLDTLRAAALPARSLAADAVQHARDAVRRSGLSPDAVELCARRIRSELAPVHTAVGPDLPAGPDLAALHPLSRTVLESVTRRAAGWGPAGRSAVRRDVLRVLELSLRHVPVLRVPSPVELSPTAHYNRACFHATKAQPDPVRAAEHLRLAVASPDLAEWEPDDPQLRTFRKTPEYVALSRRPPRDDLLDVGAFDGLRERLGTVGVRDAVGLLTLAPAALVDVAGVSGARALALRDVARLHATADRTAEAAIPFVWPDGTAVLTVELVDALWRRGRTMRATLGPLRDDEVAALSRAIATDVLARVDSALTADEVSLFARVWLLTVRDDDA
ncbi:hypothetical protein [Cellulosimicrobium marinum]|uniref:hypothetical protein n=1 Tax=Cellulosimicrobium marinum TaxID=1638992 RepID=UPI001E5029B1|nr:hypothetical protein [Cellulosimicrobium marinum]MCB7137019.1 hypothetical protein [Cellulosimicrobium marinum]